VTRAATDEQLRAALELSQRHGMLGSRPIAEVVDHATAFLAPLDELVGGATVVDLGSGGGVPGLVVAWLRPDLHLVLVERRTTRADHLRRLVARLGLGGRVDVLGVDAAALPDRLPQPAHAVTSRGFGPPAALLAVTADVLALGGLLVVAEPPRPDPRRWPDDVLARTGFTRLASPDARVAVLRRIP